ncbi:chromosome segregation protein SMC [Endozoicomonas numazuensis]|uniref:Chromosome partition protein Smc n=1 Tax=Endozoicomonas numazuensis TaxID=1137799 RepID=A0A081NFW4_9GAMM|nr:chromosome segregation protein SMC [Endozoicomonas numazuensis]KEQ17337.1 chromosome segregation protein SMC [Endozoicomonas numazuensis]
MRLKSIKLAGFKSFVDPTTVHFPSNMCGVVGPNGCGKSNIIDAVRWVMGESSAKHLRGESMTDVIFKGSNSRKPAAKATVELIFDNNEGRVTGEFAAYSEISVRRMLTSEAKNFYFLNGNKCRRKDVMDIFLGTGLGPRSYSIISQGIVSTLIESKPEELRVFIEEAAGISKYKERRRETENRIRRTNENLERLTDLRDELGRRLGHLQRQAEAAEKYKEYKADERLKKAQLQALRWQSIDESVKNQEHVISELEVQLEAAVSDQRSSDAGMEKDRAQQMELSDHFHETQAKYYGTGNEITRIEQTLRHKEERAKELSHDLQQLDQSWQEAREQMAEDQSQLEMLEEEKLQVEPELEMLQEQEYMSGDSLAQVEEEVHRLQQEWEQFNQRSHEPQKAAEVEQSRIQHAETVLERLLEREQRLSEERNSLGGGEDLEEIELLSEKLTELELTRETHELKLEEVTSEIEENRLQFDQLQEDRDSHRNELSMIRGRHASLEALQQAALGQDTGVMVWMEQHGLESTPRLAEKLQVESGWELAVETVLGDSLQALCVDDLDPVAGLLGSLEQGAAVLLDASHHQVSTDARGDLHALAGKVQSGNEAQGLLAGIYITDSLEAALSARTSLEVHESIVTKDGIWLSRNWLRVCRETDNNSGVLARQQELEQLGLRMEELESLSQQVEERLADVKIQSEQLENRRQQTQQQITELNRSHGEVRADLGARKVKLEQFSERRTRLQHEIAECQELSQAEQESIGESRLRLQEALDRMEMDSGLKEDLLEKRERGREKLEQVRQSSRQDKDRLHQLALRQQTINSQLESLRAAIERLSQQSTKLRERRELLQASLSESHSPEGELQEQLEVLLARRLEEEEAMQKARSELEEVEQRMQQLEKSRQSAEQKAQTARSRLEKLRMDWQGMQVRRTTLADQLREDQFDLDTVLGNMPEEAAEKVWEQELERLQARIDRLGAINLAAIEEYETQSERKTYLDAQNADLESALETLENAIRKIDRETRQRFKVTFEKVNTGLQELFPRVFGGGRAYLQLTGEDLLDTGVAIMAQPPGKKNSTIHLLSGGEKALTAIALVFAIFQLNPSPFCMLDEVDAPLDDANVGRYARMVSEMSDKVQFIYITHNKIAMQAASQLVGVTMQEPGVSRPVSVDVEEAAAMAQL